MPTMPQGCGVKRALPEVQVPQQSRLPTIGQDRHVFLRQRLGGESVSSGNSSTSTSSDNGSASDDMGAAGEWGDASMGTDGVENNRIDEFSQQNPHFGGGEVSGVLDEGVTGAAGLAVNQCSQTQAKAARRKRQSGSKSSGRCHRTCKRDRQAREYSSGKDGRGKPVSVTRGSYTSWATLAKPVKHAWEHHVSSTAVPCPPAAYDMDGVGTWESNHLSWPPAPSNVCSVFSPEPRPDNSMVFSVEQCSARASSTCVASYILRVRCGEGAHIVRRTWNDVTALCALLRRDGVPTTGISPGIDGVNGVGGKLMLAGAATTAMEGLEFAPTDILAPTAVSSFLRDLLSRPSTASAIPLRRFLELEFLDGTFRGGPTDFGREKAAREVAGVAAVAAATASTLSTTMLPGSPPETDGAAAASIGVPQMGSGAMIGSTGHLRVGGLRSAYVTAPAAPIIPAHPDAARDLAAVCRCLGELGAAAFTGTPRGLGVPYWAVRDGEAKDHNDLAAQRGAAMLA